jgi:hypothetical protein
MKKKFLLFCLLALAVGSAQVFADHPSDEVGIGVFLGAGTGSVGRGVYNPSLSLKFPELPIFWGINVFLGSPTGLGVSADYYLFDRDLIKDGSFDLDWHLGVGALGHLFFGNGGYFALGARLPIGLSWHINKTFELFLDATPGIGLNFGGGNFLYWIGGGELGLRVWV